MASTLGALYHWFMGLFFIPLYNDMDGVRVAQSPSNGPIIEPKLAKLKNEPQKVSSFTVNLRYLLPCLFYFSYLIDTLYLLVCGDSQWSFTGSGPSDGTFARKYLPPILAQQTDIFFLEVTIMVTGISAQFLVHNMKKFERKFRMVALLDGEGNLIEMKQNGQILSKREAKDIFKVHRKCQKISHRLTSFIVIYVIPFYNINVVFNWTWSVSDVKAFLWITLTFPYITMNVYTAICCFIFNCRYLRIRQRYQMERLESLIARSKRVIGLKRAKKVPKSCGLFNWTSWSLFSVINCHLNAVNQQITGYSSFWSRYLSIYFTALAFALTYMAFLALKIDLIKNIFAGSFLAYFASVILGLLLLITLECSVIVYNNNETLKLQRIFTVHTSRIGKMPLFAAIKFDHIEADSLSIERIGFKLLDSVQINSKMFELLFFYISSLFMKIVQHQL